MGNVAYFLIVWNVVGSFRRASSHLRGADMDIIAQYKPATGDLNGSTLCERNLLGLTPVRS